MPLLQFPINLTNKLHSSKVKHWAALIGSFLLGQGAIQIFNLVTGFFLLRWMSVENYAQFSVAFGFQSTLGMLVDAGFSGSIVALVGDRIHNKREVGAYIKAAKYFRSRLFAIIIPIAVIAFPLITAKHNWDLVTQLLLLGSIISSLFFQGWVAYYSAPLLMHQQIRVIYSPQIVGATGRLILCYFLHLISALSAWANAWISTAIVMMNGYLYRRSSQYLFDEPGENDRKISREMFNYLSPIIPTIIFTAFQGQIAVFLITIFGKTQGIAEVAALGRLSQLFVILGTFNSVIIGPYIAKVSRQDLTRRYFQILGITTMIAVTLCIPGFIYPQLFLWILGSKYQNLQIEVSWIVAGACLNYVIGVMWTMHSARRWIYWWLSLAYISTILGTQITCLVLMDLSTTLNVVYFSLFTTIAVGVFNLFLGTYGFIYGSTISKDLDN